MKHSLSLTFFFLSLILAGCFSKKIEKKPEAPSTDFSYLIAPNGQPIAIPPGKMIPQPEQHKGHLNPEHRGRPPQASPPASSASTTSIRSVTHQYGTLTLTEGQTEFTANHKAWSSWWYPLKDRELTQFERGQSSPLQKYDRLVSQLSRQNAQATQVQNKYYDSMVQPPWAGLCDARAFAASLHPEPQRSALIQGVCFTPKDLKALLIASYSSVDPDQWNGIWGQPNTPSTNNIVANDIFPQDFIKLIQRELGQKKRHLIFDSDPGTEVWTETINSAQLTIQKMGENNSVKGKLVLHTPSYKLSVDEKQKENFVGIGSIDVPFIYTFNLQGKWQGNQFIVESGEWTGDSIQSHPDFAVQLPESPTQVNRQSTNSQINGEWVDHILNLSEQAQPCR